MSSIKVINCDKPDFSIVKMSCDGDIHDKLNKYPLTQECFNKYCSTCFVGTQGSGKTSLMTNFVRNVYNKCYDSICVFMPQSSREDLKDNIFDKYLNPANLYEELNPETLDDVISKIYANKKNDMKTLVIFDDCQSVMRDNIIMKKLTHLIANQRHLNLSMFFLVQNYLKIPPQVRDLLHNIIVFKQPKRVSKRLFDEIIPVKEDEFHSIMNLVYQEPYSWMLINNRNKSIWNKWDRIVLNDE